MKILQVHNRYQMAGGEDTTVAAENQLLTAHGHEVRQWIADSRSITGLRGRLRAARETIYSRTTRAALGALLREWRPDLMHVHNSFPLISPAAYDAARDAGVAVVQTLHNYRFLCPNALFFRDGHVCEDCLQHSVPWPGVWHACYRESRLATLPLAAMIAVHRRRRTWQERVEGYISQTEFTRAKFIAAGFPAERIAVKPPFPFPAPEPGPGTGGGGYYLYVGRLTDEKGIPTLLAAWRLLGTAAPPLHIVGDGPLAEDVRAAAVAQPNIKPQGPLPRDQVLQLMARAEGLVFPSVWYETFGMTIIEAYAFGLPVIASNVGVMTTLVHHGCTGRQFQAGDPADLAAQVRHWLAHPDELARMRVAARAEFEAKYTAERNYEMLRAIYQRALGRRAERGVSACR